MVEDITFRAWDKARNEWYREGCASMLTYKGFSVFGECTLTDPPYISDLANLEVTQYTGLKDNNGKGNEMCQGDIVHASGHGNGTVDKNRWGEWGLMFGDEFESFHDLIMEQDLGFIQGNIYQNSELLNNNNQDLKGNKL